jgi:hypothetical protein
MHDVLLVLVPGFLQASGAVALVTLALMATLPVAVVYVDIQVMALFLGDFLRKLVLFIFIFLVLP